MCVCVCVFRLVMDPAGNRMLPVTGICYPAPLPPTRAPAAPEGSNTASGTPARLRLAAKQQQPPPPSGDRHDPIVLSQSEGDDTTGTTLAFPVRDPAPSRASPSARRTLAVHAGALPGGDNGGSGDCGSHSATVHVDPDLLAVFDAPHFDTMLTRALSQSTSASDIEDFEDDNADAEHEEVEADQDMTDVHVQPPVDGDGQNEYDPM